MDTLLLLGESSGVVSTTPDYRFALDPIDGTADMFEADEKVS
ncbi:hypothetical protein [Halomarina rubra]|uniref:Fructose-bisphosphatase n=1 Tax=Halomarina rubra TaxID=2071873 RepID=A0ABD6ARN7_9EURY|nr:hypothetical protein [Halomarina rubra]